MSRDLTTAVKNESLASTNRPVYLAKFEYASGTVYANSTNRTITWNGNDYLGVGNYGSLSQIDEDSELRAAGVSAVLSGIPAANISIAFNEHFQGRTATIYMGYLDTDYALIADPFIIFRGRMDTQKISVGEVAQIVLNIENRFVDWDRPRVSRYNNESQQSRYPGDKFFEFVEQTTDKAIFWGVEAK